MNNKGADQTARMRRLICVSVGRIWLKTGFRPENFRIGIVNKYIFGKRIYTQTIIIRITKKSVSCTANKMELIFSWTQNIGSAAFDSYAVELCSYWLILMNDLQTQIRYRRTRCLIWVFTVSVRNHHSDSDVTYQTAMDSSNSYSSFTCDTS